MKCTEKNIRLISNILITSLNDEHGHGEFDEQSDLLTSVERVIEWIKDERRTNRAYAKAAKKEGEHG